MHSATVPCRIPCTRRLERCLPPYGLEVVFNRLTASSQIVRPLLSIRGCDLSGPSDDDELEVGASPNRRDAIALEMILNCKPKLYVSVAGEPTICLPLDSQAAEQTPFRLRSGRVRAELYQLIRDEGKFLPFEQEVNRVLWYLEARAWKDVRTSIDYKAALDEHPVIEAVHILVHSQAKATFEGKASKLLKDLDKVGFDNGLDVRHKAWPKAANALSEELWNVRSTLSSGGIDFERGRKNGARWIKLGRTRRLDDDDDLSSRHRPDRNLTPSTDLHLNGDSDGAAAAVFARIRAPSEGDCP